MLREKLCLALDVDSFAKAKEIVDDLYESVGFFKVGKQLFTTVGPQIVEYIHSKGTKVFLDLKFHDIPNTVRGAAEAAAKRGVFMFNVHASGGSEMMKAAMQGVKDSGSKDVLILAVTVLTSTNAEILKNETHVLDDLENYVKHLAQLAKKSGLSGVVASPLEIKMIREACGKDFIILTPGVRPEWAEKGDQKRTLTPKEAIDAGADYIVIGRPILQAKDRKEAVEKIVLGDC